MTLRCGEEFEAQVIVELIGPTGSGKTTLAAALVARLRVDGITVHEAERIALGRLHDSLPRSGLTRALAVHVVTLPWLVRAAVSSPTTLAYLALVAWRHGERFTFRLGCLRNAGRRFGLWSRARSGDRPDEVIVMDEGLAQFVDMLAESRRTPTTGEVAAYVERVPLPDLIVHLVIPDSVRADRMRKREHRRMRDASDDTLLTYAANGGATARLFAEHPLVAPRAVTIAMGEGPGAIDEVARVLTDVVRHALQRAQDATP